MGVGHLAASFALRSRFPRVPLYALLLAGVLLDLLWAVAIVAGVEHAHIDRASPSSIPIVLDSVPFTHSLVASTAWGALAGVAWWLARRDRAGAWVLAALVVSHWVLDYVSHVPDVPVLTSGPIVGLGLWRSRAASLVVAVILTALGAAAFFATPPPSILPLAIGNFVLAFLLLPVEWIDRHRPSRVVSAG